MSSPQRISASPIVRFNLLASAFFAVVAVVSAVVFDDVFRVVIVVVSLTLFAVGVATFLIGFFAAVQSSRESEISVSQLFFLTGEVASRDVKVPMLAALAVQTVAGIATAIARPTTDGKTGSVLAFGVLVPMLGLGLNGLWASRHGAFAERGQPGEGDESAADPDE
ncbi:MAG: hypothetical protein ACKO8T_00440 [Actinomycetota bacterium]